MLVIVEALYSLARCSGVKYRLLNSKQRLLSSMIGDQGKRTSAGRWDAKTECNSMIAFTASSNCSQPRPVIVTDCLAVCGFFVSLLSNEILI